MGRYTLLLALWMPAAAIAAGDVQISGAGSFIDTTFTYTCIGAPTCSGVYTAVYRLPECNSPFSYSSTFTLTGVNLAQPGSFGGTIFLSGGNVNAHSVNGACTPTYSDFTSPYTGMWDGRSGTITILAPEGNNTSIFTANVSSAPPVFPMAVTGNITPATANVTAQIQPRPQDVGTVGSIFVFAHAPANQLKDAIDKREPSGPIVPVRTLDDAIVCVLAQVNGQGQLIAVSASSMQAYLSGTLSSQTQAVGILNNVPTPNVAGATFFVGYGTSAAAMLANGVYQNAITIPGTNQCTASLASAPAPSTPGALTGLWWNAAESGWGIHFTQRGANVFAAWYTYDSLGKPKWYVSTCAGFTGASGTCNGTLYEVTGPSFFGASFNPSLVNAANAGTMQVNFRDPGNASMTYTVAGQTRTVTLVRQPLATGTTPPAVDYTDLWWNPSESGWGMAMAQQYGITFLAWYVYDNNGKPTWQVATCTMSGSSCSGTLYRTTGPPFGPTFNSSLVQASVAGTIRVNFTDANNAILNYTVDGVSATRAITRQLF